MAGLNLGSLRVRLVILVLLGALPALGLTFYSGLEARQDTVNVVRARVMAIARHASQMQQRYLAQARQTLFTLCQLPQLHHLDAAATAPILKDVLKKSGMFSAFLATRPDGLVFASAPKSRRTVNLKDRPYFKRLIKTGRFVVGHFILGRITGRPVLALAHPVKDPAGKLQGALVTGLKLDWLDKYFAGLNLPPDTHLAVIDRFGRMLVHLPEHRGMVGRNVKDLAITRIVLKRRQGMVEAPGFWGQARLFAFTSLGHNGQVYILIGVSKTKAFAPVMARTVRNLVFLGIVFLLAILAAWFGGTVLIGRPVGKIVDVMTRVSGGDFAARVGADRSSGELGLLAQGLDRMVEMLAFREAQLKQQSEATYRAIFNASEDAIFIHDLTDGSIIDVNQKVEELFGYTPEEAAQLTIDELGTGVEPYTLADARKWIQKTVQEGPQVVEWQCRHKDGHLFWTENTLKVADIAGERRLLAVLRDITARKEIEQALEFERAQLLALFEGIDDVMYVSDPETYELLYVNPALRAGWGEDIIGQKCYAALQGRDSPCPFCTNDIIFGEKLGQTYVWEFQNEITQGWYRCADKAIRWADGKMVRFEIAGEITERKRMEQERTELLAEMEAKNAELERFTYTVSHDLKSPLITIKGFLGLLEKDANAGDAKQLGHDIERIAEAVEKMGRLLEELLELSRIGRLMNPPEDVAVTELAEGAVNMVRGQLEQGKIQVTIQPDLPLVFGDRLRLREVLENLVSNAAKFMGDQVAPRIEIGLRRENDEDVFFVRDNGIGIDPQYHAKVFELFEQLRPGGEGTGIGLALVKRIVEVHGGRIWVESEGEGTGTTFCFTLSAAGGAGQEEG